MLKILPSLAKNEKNEVVIMSINSEIEIKKKDWRIPSQWGVIFKEEKVAELLLRILAVFFLLYLFLVGVKTLETSIKLMGGGFAKTLFSMSANPIASLFAGMLATVLLQSSSVTTSLIVGLVSSGTLPLTGAIPMVMGANLGTTVTNTLASIGCVNNPSNFKRAFAAATIHDFFNILSVLVLFPLEVFTGVLEKLATGISSFLYGGFSGISYHSPVKAALKPLVKSIEHFVMHTLGVSGSWAGIAIMIIGAVTIIASLALIVKIMNTIVQRHKGDIVNKILSKNALATILFGAGLTVAVQSSSITTSLLVPMAGSGLITLDVVFPLTVGANIGTTATALLAALAGNVHGLSIALVHLLFNIFGTLIWFAPKKTRAIPVMLANTVSVYVGKKRSLSLVYIILIFFMIPISLVYIMN